MKWIKNLSAKQKKICLLVAICLVVVVAGLVWFFSTTKTNGWNAPTLTIETPQKMSSSNQEEFLIDVSISRLGDAQYPAASFSINFDSSRLEFLGLKEGNIFIQDTPNANGMAQKLPEWNCNTEQSNKLGQINIMYLDVTGGKYAFNKELLHEQDNVIFRLAFRLRGSARQGDVCELLMEDAVFAASDSNQSLAMLQDTLAVKNGKIVIGE